MPGANSVHGVAFSIAVDRREEFYDGDMQREGWAI